MDGPHIHSTDYEQSKRNATLRQGPEQAGSTITTAVSVAENVARLPNSANIGASYNAPVRAAARHSQQQSHGNRAVQRALGTGTPSGRVAVQRNVSVQRDQVDPVSLLYQPQPFGPVPAPVYGPTLAPASNAGSSGAQPYESGGVSVMDDTGRMDAGMEDPVARTQAINDAMSAAYCNDDVCEMPYNAFQPASPSSPSVAPVGDEGESNVSRAGDVNNGVSATTTAANMLMMESPIFKGLPTLAEDFNIFSLAKGGSGALNTGSSALGVGLGIYNLINADNTSDRVQAGADTLASGAGFFGPVGSAFSGGYSAGQLLDKGVDWVGDKIWGEGDHSLHHGIAEHVLPHVLPSPERIRAGWAHLWGNRSEEEQEQWDNREFAVELDHKMEARKEREQKARDEQEMAELREQMEHPTVGGTMLGGPGDALSGKAIMEQFVPTQYDEDGVPLPRVSMALPEPATKRKR